MQNAVVSILNNIVGRLLTGALNVFSAHPVLTFSFLTLMLALACTIWVDVGGFRLDATRRQNEAARGRPIRVLRR